MKVLFLALHCQCRDTTGPPNGGATQYNRRASPILGVTPGPFALYPTLQQHEYDEFLFGRRQEQQLHSLNTAPFAGNPKRCLTLDLLLSVSAPWSSSFLVTRVLPQRAARCSRMLSPSFFGLILISLAPSNRTRHHIIQTKLGCEM